ncbi:hypothetical protein DSO57_1015426 [Entomophthora muscae]|uniref:Uncharacterized protein n=1 Tax=Entomophthora muscae TaxID=34485 RepID=A0ACC2T5A0_9FUNG|nr:hypothetical protein DSO57_1015426 [Entomophthora muscae]
MPKHTAFLARVSHTSSWVKSIPLIHNPLEITLQPTTTMVAVAPSLTRKGRPNIQWTDWRHLSRRCFFAEEVYISIKDLNLAIDMVNQQLLSPAEYIRNDSGMNLDFLEHMATYLEALKFKPRFLHIADISLFRKVTLFFLETGDLLEEAIEQGNFIFWRDLFIRYVGHNKSLSQSALVMCSGCFSWLELDSPLEG